MTANIPTESDQAPRDSTLTPILFLDIDDVLCINRPYGGYDALHALAGQHANAADVYRRLFAKRACDVLISVHEAIEGELRYVISSTWREYFGRDDLAMLLTRGGLPQVASNLVADRPWCTPSSGRQGSRAGDIADWLAQHHRGEAYAIVDDLLSGASLKDALEQPDHAFQNRVVLCDEFVGLCEHHAASLVTALSTPAARAHREGAQ